MTLVSFRLTTASDAAAVSLTRLPSLRFEHCISIIYFSKTFNHQYAGPRVPDASRLIEKDSLQGWVTTILSRLDLLRRKGNAYPGSIRLCRENTRVRHNFL